jgi:bifunctional non-homologous end joining protein LigD
MADATEKVWVKVDGHELSLTNLSKVLYPQTGFTKGEVIDYYTRIAPVLLPHLADRPLTVKRYPNGVDGPHFFEKNAARGTPDWVRTVTLPVPGSTMKRETIDFVVVDSLAALVRMANLAALELHVPQWRVAPRQKRPDVDLVVFDLDPGPGASIVQCCEVALLLRDTAAEDGLTLFPKTSGSKGMQLSAPISVADPDIPSRYAQSLAVRLERARPELVVSRMSKSLRPGKVFVDWSQNSPAKTTVCVYSLRAREEQTVSTPLNWDEVESGRELRFTAENVLARVREHGDLHAGCLDENHRVELTGPVPTSE